MNQAAELSQIKEALSLFVLALAKSNAQMFSMPPELHARKAHESLLQSEVDRVGQGRSTEVKGVLTQLQKDYLESFSEAEISDKPVPKIDFSSLS